MKKTATTLLILFAFCQFANAQSTGYYYKYDFEQYLISKTVDSLEYMQKLKAHLKYPAIARENQIEGRLDFLLINHGNNQTELILKQEDLLSTKVNVSKLSSPYHLFYSQLKAALEKTDAELLKHNKEKFMTALSVLFEMKHLDTYSDADRNVDFVIIGKEVRTVKYKAINTHSLI